MYACITDPETGKRIYADIHVGARVGFSFSLEYAHAMDVITENEFADTIVQELRGVKITDHTLLTAVLKDEQLDQVLARLDALEKARETPQRTRVQE